MATHVGTADAATAPTAYSARERTLIIASAMLGWGLEFFDFMLLALLAPQIIKDFGLSTAAFGSVFSVQLVATAVGGVLFGWLADLYGRRLVLSWTIWLFSLSTLAVVFAHSLGVLMLLRFLTGLGTGGEWAIGFSLLNEAWTPVRRGFAGSVVQASLWPAYALAIFVAGAVPHWRWAFAIGAFPALAAVFVRWWCPESRQWQTYMELKRRGELPPQVRSLGARSTLAQIFAPGVLATTVLGTLCVFGAQYLYYSVSGWMPAFLGGTLHFDKATASHVLYLGTFISLCSYLVAGWLSDLVGRRRIFMLFGVLALLGVGLFALLHFSGHDRATVWAYYFYNVGIGLFAIFGVWFGELFPTRARATGSAFCYSVGRGLAGAGPLIVGALAGSIGLGGGMATAVIATLVLLVTAYAMEERRGRAILAVE